MAAAAALRALPAEMAAAKMRVSPVLERRVVSFDIASK
jgi:hypothetical protein